MVEHTPGPWDVETDIMSYAAAIRSNWHGGRKTIAYVEGPGLSPAGTEGRRTQGICNAHLIAAAPELLTACEMALEVIESGMAEYGRYRDPDGSDEDVTVRLRAAVAKATGETAS